jgi:hypothetical protein
MSSNGLFIAGGVAALAYFTRNSWLPSATLTATDAGALSVVMNAPQVTTNNQPVGPNTPGAVPVGNQGCYGYTDSSTGRMIIGCPAGVNPPLTTPSANLCQSGYTMDAGGICTKYPDAVLLAQLNTIPWTGLSDIPAEQIQRIDPQILQTYSSTTGVNAGTALAYILGLGANPTDGTIINGSDGNAYKALGGVFYLQGTGTRLNRIGGIAAALPITNATLIEASSDPTIAALVGNDPRAMLTAAQWNYYYAQASGVLQAVALHPQGDPRALMSAAQYQAARQAAGLQIAQRMGTLRPAHKGAFPLGRIGLINQWVPPGNRTIYQIPGRGAVPAGRGGMVPPAHPFSRMGLISDGGGNHRWARSPFPRPTWWREAAN